MKLRERLAWRYAGVVGVCVLLLAGLAYHEFVTEPQARKARGIPELPESFWGEYAEVFFYGMIPVVLSCGWWLMRRTLAPIDDLTRAVQRIHADNLRQPLPRSFTDDEVDRLTAVFNSMAARLDQSFQQIRQFTLHASHELKTPLTVMRVDIETLLQNEKSLSATQVEWLECQLDEVQRLSKIVDALTLLTKADTGLVKLERRPVALAELVRECFEDAQILAEPGQIKVTLGVCDEAEIQGDRHRLRQLLLNLADNAVKYNRPGGRVTLTLRRQNDTAELEIGNTGEGLSPEMQARAFERFVRGDEARTRAIEGCGLGLAICRWIVQAHGGTIALESEPGRMTIARVRLPVTAPAGAEALAGAGAAVHS